MGIPVWRLPFWLFFFGFCSAAITDGLELAHRSKPEPFGRF
jgi:hypothetical protein